MRERICRALDLGGGVLSVADFPSLGRAARHEVRAGRLRLVVAGVYAVPGQLTHQQRVLALAAGAPSAVLIGESAAAVLGWPGAAEPELCSAASILRSRPGYRFVRRSVPSPLIDVVRGVRVTSPALTALDLTDIHGGAAIDDALRCGVRLRDLEEALALTAQRPGNGARRRLLEESRTEPWSEAERAAHAALRRARILGWRANVPLPCGGRRVIGDLVFRAQKVVVEIDGRRFHDSWEQRERDLAKDRGLAAEGWLVVRFPAGLVLSDPDAFVRELLAVLARR